MAHRSTPRQAAYFRICLSLLSRGLCVILVLTGIQLHAAPFTSAAILVSVLYLRRLFICSSIVLHFVFARFSLCTCAYSMHPDLIVFRRDLVH
jgi:hypothetical protein